MTSDFTRLETSTISMASFDGATSLQKSLRLNGWLASLILSFASRRRSRWAQSFPLQYRASECRPFLSGFRQSIDHLADLHRRPVAGRAFGLMATVLLMIGVGLPVIGRTLALGRNVSSKRSAASLPYFVVAKPVGIVVTPASHGKDSSSLAMAAWSICFGRATLPLALCTRNSDRISAACLSWRFEGGPSTDKGSGALVRFLCFARYVSIAAS